MFRFAAPVVKQVNYSRSPLALSVAITCPSKLDELEVNEGTDGKIKATKTNLPQTFSTLQYSSQMGRTLNLNL